MSDRNRTIIRRSFEEVYNQGNLAAVDELVARDIVVHTNTQDIHGPEELKQYVAALREAFPDLQMTVEDQIAAGDTVVTRWTARGTHTGPFQGIPPTGRAGSVTGIDIDRLADGRVVECWSQMDDLGLLQQLGVISAPTALEAGASTTT